jgi:hypothetical protein
MTTEETSKLTGIPLDLLISMRTRRTSTLQSGPPFSRVVDKDGTPIFKYNKAHVKSWMKNRNALITAAEAAKMIGITREEILNITGIKRFDFPHGSIVIKPTDNLFVFVLKRGKK